MSYGNIYQFLQIAEKCQSFAEFKLEIVFKGKADIGTEEFYSKHIKPLVYDNIIDDAFGAYLDNSKVKSYLLTRLYAISWLNDYLNSFKPPEKLHDDVSIFDPALVSKC